MFMTTGWSYPRLHIIITIPYSVYDPSLHLSSSYLQHTQIFYASLLAFVSQIVFLAEAILGIKKHGWCYRDGLRHYVTSSSFSYDNQHEWSPPISVRPEQYLP